MITAFDDVVDLHHQNVENNVHIHYSVTLTFTFIFSKSAYVNEKQRWKWRSTAYFVHVCKNICTWYYCGLRYVYFVAETNQ